MPWPGSLTEIWTVLAAGRTRMVMTLGLEAELRGVDDQVRQRLRQAAAVAAHEQAFVRDVDLQRVAAGVQLVMALRDRLLDHALDRDLLAHERDLALGGAGDVDQLLDKVAHSAHLSFDDLAQPHEDGIGVLERAQDARGVGDGGQRVAQLVRQHGEELALPPLGQTQLLRALGQRFLQRLAVVDVDERADEAGRATPSGPRRGTALSSIQRYCAVVRGAGAGRARRRRRPRSSSAGCRRSDRRPPGGPNGASRRPGAPPAAGRCSRPTSR